MKKFISFGDIGQFRNVMKSIKSMAQFVGLDENDEAIYDPTIKLPIVQASMSEKLHGTNSAVCYSNSSGFWVQSRKNIITLEKDNAGCAFEAMKNQEAWMEIIKLLSKQYKINLDENIISVYYEWAGGNIQKNSALTNVDKSSMIFDHFKVTPISSIGIESPEVVPYWLKTNGVESKEHRIYNILNFNRWDIEIDFNKPHEAVNKMVDFVEKEIEPASPIGKAFGQEANIGEGVVVTFEFRGNVLKFKVKGNKHSKSHVTKLKKVDSEKINKVIDFANEVCTSSRLEQAWQTVFGIDEEKLEPSKKFTSDIIRAVVSDILKEEIDIMMERDITPKDIGSTVAQVTRDWFFVELGKYIFGDK